jgi:hypothetical protein
MKYPRTAAAIKSLDTHTNSHTGRKCDLCRATLERVYAAWRAEGGSIEAALDTIRVECVERRPTQTRHTTTTTKETDMWNFTPGHPDSPEFNAAELRGQAEFIKRTVDSEYGEEHQTNKEDAFFGRIYEFISEEDQAKLETYGIEATTEEIIDYGLTLALAAIGA